MRLASKAVFDRISGELFTRMDWLVFDGRGVVLEVEDVAVLVRLLHLRAPQAEGAAAAALHIVLDVVRPHVVVGRRGIALHWSY